MKFEIGDRVRDVDRPKLEGRVVRLPGFHHSYRTCYGVQWFTSAPGLTNCLTQTEIEHVDAVTQLGELSE